MRSLILTQLPNAISLCRATCGADVQELGGELAVREAQEGLVDGNLKIIALIDHPRALLHLQTFEEASPRLLALVWDGAKMAQALHAPSLRDQAGALHSPLEQARNLVLFTARGCGLLAFDCAESGVDEASLRARCHEAKALGFDGKIATDDDQARVIQEAFA